MAPIKDSLLNLDEIILQCSAVTCPLKRLHVQTEHQSSTWARMAFGTHRRQELRLGRFGTLPPVHLSKHQDAAVDPSQHCNSPQHDAWTWCFHSA